MTSIKCPTSYVSSAAALSAFRKAALSSFRNELAHQMRRADDFVTKISFAPRSERVPDFTYATRLFKILRPSNETLQRIVDEVEKPFPKLPGLLILVIAHKANDLAIALIQLKRGLNTSLKSCYDIFLPGDFPLHVAIINDSPEIVTPLLANEANPNPKDEAHPFMPSPLGLSLLRIVRDPFSMESGRHVVENPKEQKKIFSQLVSAGGDPEAVLLHQHATVFSTSISLGAREEALLLHTKIQGMGRFKYHFLTPLHLAACADMSLLAEQLVGRGFKVDSLASALLDQQYKTPLHFAVRYRAKETIGTLMRLKADPNKSADNSWYTSNLSKPYLNESERIRDRGGPPITPFQMAAVDERTLKPKADLTIARLIYDQNPNAITATSTLCPDWAGTWSVTNVLVQFRSDSKPLPLTTVPWRFFAAPEFHPQVRAVIDEENHYDKIMSVPLLRPLMDFITFQHRTDPHFSITIFKSTKCCGEYNGYMNQIQIKPPSISWVWWEYLFHEVGHMAAYKVYGDVDPSRTEKGSSFKQAVTSVTKDRVRFALWDLNRYLSWNHGSEVFARTIQAMTHTIVVQELSAQHKFMQYIEEDFRKEPLSLCLKFYKENFLPMLEEYMRGGSVATTSTK